MTEALRRARLADEVFRLAAGGGRGAQAAAIKQVAAKHRMASETIKKHVQRWSFLRPTAEAVHRALAAVEESQRRCAGMPDDVLERLEALPFGRLLRLLRRYEIDGTCPRWFIKCVRNATNQNADDLLKALEIAGSDFLSPNGRKAG